MVGPLKVVLRGIKLGKSKIRKNLKGAKKVQCLEILFTKVEWIVRIRRIRISN